VVETSQTLAGNRPLLGGARALLLAGLGLALATGAATAREITIGVVTDGPGPNTEVVAAVEQELAKHLPRDTTARWRSDPAFDAGWGLDRAAAALGAALGDPGVDYVLTLGFATAREAARPDLQLTKPVLNGFVQPADIFGLAYGRTDRSAKENLAVIAVPSRMARDVERFRQLVPFRSLTVPVNAQRLDFPDDLREAIAAFEKRLGIQIDFVGVSDDVDAAIAGIGNAEAVYLTRLERLDRAARQQLIDALNAKGIPTFSGRGNADVHMGALAAQTPDFSQQVVRRLALNLSRLIRGESASTLPVLMSVDTRLTINAATAKAIGWSPDRETRIFARYLNPEALELSAESLELAAAFELAEQENTDLEIEDAVVESAREDQFTAKSALLPQISTQLSAVQAETDFLDAESAAIGQLALRQQIWDDRARSNYRGSQQLFLSAEEDRETVRLDVLADTGAAFYGLGLSQALYRIEADNLQLTEEFLGLAELRREVGYSGREEILRWQSAVAESRGRLFRQNQDVETTRIALNRILGIDQGRRWYPAETEIDPEVFTWLDGKLGEMFGDVESGERIKDELVRFAMENAPELRSLDRIIEAQQIETDRLKRRYTVPDVFAQGAYENQLTDADNPIFPEEWSYSVGVFATYPLFEGGRRKHELASARADLDGLSRQRDLVAELVEQRTRSAIQRAVNSFPRVKFSRQAADAATESLELVRDQYTEGTVNVTDLLDAQNQKFTADQAVTIAIFEFLADLIALERAIGWFEADQGPGARDALAERLFSAAGGP
jgi:outer membrane protein TolC